MKTIEIDIPVKIEPKRRPRARVIQKKSDGKYIAFLYEDSKTKENAKAIIWFLKKQMAQTTPFEKNVPLGISMEIYTAHNRGDLDNYIKQVLDCANGILWHDDVQIHYIEKASLVKKSPTNRLILKVWETGETV
jgi:Holliday junction resolvase RusA-like endonuclease